jgi:hypothetical protein
MQAEFDKKYECIIICIASQLRQSGIWSKDTSMNAIARSVLPKDFWDYFTSLTRNETKIIELTEDLFLELVNNGSNVCACLKLKMIGCIPLTIAKW